MLPDSALISFPNPALPALTIDQVIARRNIMVEFVQRAMVRDTDYGTIPGTERKDGNGKTISKDTLFKPGAEKLCTLFGLSTRFVLQDSIEDWTGDEHGGEPLFYFRFKCQLYRGDVFMGEGEGSCSSWEKKYRYRTAQRVCPQCGKPTIYKSKNAGEGWYCWTKKDGCGAKFVEDAPAIVNQESGQVPNPDIADIANTVLKMAQKRAHIAATLTTVNASEFFTQDLEDLYIKDENGERIQVKVVESTYSGNGTPKPEPERETQTNARRAASTRTHPPIAPVQRQKLAELYRLLHGGTEIDVHDGLERIFVEQFRHGILEATYEEGARITGQLLSQLRNKATPAPQPPAPPPKPEAPAPTSNGIAIPEPLTTVLRAYATRQFDNAEKRRVIQGLVAGTLDEYAGDTDRRRAFLVAVFNKDSSRALTDGEVMALAAWKAHPRAKDEVNRIIADYLKLKGQTELPLPELNLPKGPAFPSKTPITEAHRDELRRVFLEQSGGDVDFAETQLDAYWREKFHHGIGDATEAEYAQAANDLAPMPF